MMKELRLGNGEMDQMPMVNTSPAESEDAGPNAVDVKIPKPFHMDRLLICAAYWMVANRWHSGQASRGYVKLSQLSRMGYNPGLASWRSERGSDERRAAARLMARRRREIRLEW
ncbi:hypothetical protein SBA4_4590031 [Candidatus Sulfopaludibacter sp. SbA4]|nr:hypothetical protein SBA4_4590031 [Candidatus Sulfopaludibacter sp. SbA4]